MRVLTVCGIFILLLAPIPGRPLAQEQLPIIDMHLHADLPPHEIPAGAPALCRPEPCRGDSAATAGPAATLEQTLQAMKRHNIVKGFVSGFDLDVVAQWVRAAPDRVIGAPFILKPGQHDLKRLPREYAAGHLGGLGEIATQLSGIAPNDGAPAHLPAAARFLRIDDSSR